jgi:uncharacterized protein
MMSATLVVKSGVFYYYELRGLCSMREKRKIKLIAAGMSAAALIAASVVISAGLTRIIHADRTVSVRGLDERDVDADMAVWSLAFSAGGDDLSVLQKKIVTNTAVITAFLEQHGLERKDFTIVAPEITDTTVNVYIDNKNRKFNYVAKQAVLIRTGKVAAVRAAADDTLALMGKGIAVSADYENKVQYYFNGLNAVKPEMIAAATKSARLAAEQFAHDSGSKVGKIMNATQGLFTVEDAAPGLEQKKHIRVVTTVVYSLAD